ncbi:MAG TPA: DUF2321 domain-containing protein [Terriglobales bacterium]|nr:DUF2321 domain-containing protein [Terriglobales bacterium]
MSSDVPLKVVIENAQLHRSSQDYDSQTAAIVYMRNEEYQVLAPPKSEGNALEWSDHWVVRRDHYDVNDWRRRLAIDAVKKELESLARDQNRVVDLNPDGRFYDAYICTTGHVKSSTGGDFQGEHCEKCGAKCIDECPACQTPIRGRVYKSTVAGYIRPEFCHQCGKPYPWMHERLQTARELLDYEKEIPEIDR